MNCVRRRRAGRPMSLPEEKKGGAGGRCTTSPARSSYRDVIREPKPILRMRRALVLLLLLPLVPLTAGAQQPLPNSLGEFYSYGDNYFIEIATLPGLVPGKGRGVVTFRLTNDLMTFRKTSRSYQKGSLYIATPTLYLEAINADGVIVDRATWRDTARAADFERVMQDSRRSRLAQGALEWHLLRDISDAGHYTEQIVDESWTEHLRRFDRVTAADIALRERKLAFHLEEAPPRVTRYVVDTPRT